MKAYQPSGNLDSRSWPALLGFGLGGAFSVGYLSGLITQFIDLIILFPILMGFGVGFAIKMGVRNGHCRNAFAITLVAFSMGILCYGVKLYVNYRNTRAETITFIQGKIDEEYKKAFQGSKPPEGTKIPDPAEIYNDILIEKTGSSGFYGHMKMLLDNGISISSSHGSSKGGGLNLGWFGSLILLLIEAGLAGFFAYSTGLDQLKVPYCERCFGWSELATAIATPLPVFGGVAQGLMELTPASPPPEGILHALQAADENGEHGRIELWLCQTCKEGYLSGYAMTPNADGKGLAKTAVFENLVCEPKLLVVMRRAPSEGSAAGEAPFEGPAPKLNLPAGQRPAAQPARPGAPPARPPANPARPGTTPPARPKPPEV